jgi:hypothetical protein
MSRVVIIAGECEQIIHCSVTAEGKEPFILAVKNINVISMQRFQKASAVLALKRKKQDCE